MPDMTEAEILDLAAKVYNRQYLDGHGEIVEHALALERSYYLVPIVRLALQEAGVLDRPALPAPRRIITKAELTAKQRKAEQRAVDSRKAKR